MRTLRHKHVKKLAKEHTSGSQWPRIATQGNWWRARFFCHLSSRFPCSVLYFACFALWSIFSSPLPRVSFSYHYFRLTSSQEKDVLLSLRELRQLSKGPIWETVRRARCSLYIPGMPAGPWNVVELWYERGSEAPSFLSVGLQPGDLWYLQGLPEFPLLPVGLSQEMASSFNLLLNSTLFGRKSLTFVVCVWYPFQSKPPPNPHPTPP